MKLLRISQGGWEVLAVIDHRDRCPLLRDLESIDRSVKCVATMYTMLLEDVPSHGPRFDNRNFCSSLGDGIWQFKRGPKHGRKLRVPFFYTEDRRVVCTEAALKTDRLPRAVIERAHQHRLEFATADNVGDIEIIELEDFDG